MTGNTAVTLGDPSGVAEARRAADRLGRRAGFDAQDLGRLALVVTELSTNVVKHAGAGHVVLEADFTDPGCCRVVAIDSGPGFDLDSCLRDGHSTSGSPGTGLGAIARLSDTFDVHTQPGRGSVLLAEIRAGRVPPPATCSLLLAGISVPKEGESECGDAWACKRGNGSVTLVLVADGIGHGPDAALASRLAVRTFDQAREHEPAALVERVHEALRPTRGATVGVAAVDPAAREVYFAGLGNIAGAIAGPDATRFMVSHNGTAGHEARRIQQFTYPWPDDALLVMSSDGLSLRWNLSTYPGLASRHPAVIAGVLYRDFGRSRDDVTVVVGELPRSGWAREAR